MRQTPPLHAAFSSADSPKDSRKETVQVKILARRFGGQFVTDENQGRQENEKKERECVTCSVGQAAALLHFVRVAGYNTKTPKRV